MRVLVACEESQVVCKEFRKLGYYVIDERAELLVGVIRWLIM